MAKTALLQKSRCLMVTAFLFVIGLIAACDSKPAEHQWSGQTMGTFYRLTLAQLSQQQLAQVANIEREIESLLLSINALMSTYDASSEISLFNALPAGECLAVSTDFFELAERAVAIAEQSSGSFNPMVAPLVNRWGFGPSDSQFEFPEPAEIRSLLEVSGLDALVLNRENTQFCKQHNDAQMDLSAMAKGYAVDRIATYLMSVSIDNFLVDIGGELRVAGVNAEGEFWRLAIEKPEHARNSVHEVITLTDAAVATSGDYRNFFEHDGQFYSHTINPTTGYPVQHGMASVTVVADNAADADAWATALLAAGPQQARVLADKYKLAIYFIRRENGAYRSWHSQAFSVYLTD